MTVALAAALVAVGPVDSGAATAADFYQGKTLRLVVSSDTGGGYDAYARTFASHLRRHIPGEPTIIVQNMPGAGGMAAANWTFNVAPKDGTVLLLHQRGIPFHPYFGEKSAMFVPTDFNWIGSFNSETGITAMWHTAKVKKFEDVFTETAVLGGSGPNDSETYPFLMNNTIGTKFKIVSGYKSNVTAWLAMERGEVEGVSGSWASLKANRPHWIRDKQVNLIVQVDRRKHADLPDVPLLLDYVKEPEHRLMWNVMIAIGDHGPAAGDAARRAGGAGRDAARGVRGDDEGPGLSRRDAEEQPRALADRRRGDAGHDARGRRGAARDAGEAQCLDQAAVAGLGLHAARTRRAALHCRRGFSCAPRRPAPRSAGD